MAPESEFQKLIMAITESDYKTLIQLAEENRSRKDTFSFYNSFKNRHESEMAKTLTALNRMLLQFMEKSAGNSGKIEWASADPKGISEISQVFQAAIDIAITSFHLKFTPSESLLQMALLLNGILPEIPHSEDSLKNSIAQLCEKLYSVNYVEKSEYFLSNVIIYLLRRTLAVKSLKTDVKRVYNLRNVIRTIMTLDQTTSVEIWLLLRKCASSALYLSMTEGQKVIAMCMTLDVDRIAEIHDILKVQLPAYPLKIATGCGKIYFDAWYHSVKTRNPELKNVFEITCLQDYLLLAIRSTGKMYLHSVRKLLAQFHCHKKDFEVAKMLYILYQPLLWRFLKVLNPDGQIRANACQLFLDIFPLEDPEVNVVDTDLELNDQLLLIKDLLVDEYPIVRVTTVVGICVSMSINWEVFPEEILKTYFRIIIDELSCDSSCEEVRVAVVKGVKVLLENPLTIPTLQSILPKLQGLFHDISQNVRVAFCQLLLRVKNISAIKYFEIVPFKHLLARMEEDCHAVKKCIANLIHNSYFPKNGDSKIWLGRCIEIFKSDPGAARVLFTYVSSLIGMENSVKFVIQAIKAIHFYVRTTQTSNKKGSPMKSRSRTENIVRVGDYFISLEEAVGFDNVEVVRALLDCISIMWLTLKNGINMPENKGFLKMLVAKIGMPLTDLCLHYKDSDIWKSVFYISSFLPAYIVPSLGSLCFWRLKNLPPNAEPHEYMIVVECLCNQHQALELLQLLHEWISVAFNDSFKPPVKKRKKKGSITENIYYDDPKPYLANEMLNVMLCHRGMQKAIFMFDDALRNMLTFIDSIKTRIESTNAKAMSGREATFLKLLMFNLLRISVFLHDVEQSKSVKFVDDVADWVEKKLLKHLTATKFLKSDIFTELICSICKNLCEIMADVVALGFCDPDNTVYLQIFVKLLNSNLGFRFALIASKFLYKHAGSGQFEYLIESETIMLQHSMEAFCKVVTSFSKENLLDRIPTNDLKEIQFILASVMQIVNNHVCTLSSPASAAFKSIIRSILVSTVSKSSLIVIKMGNEYFNKVTLSKQGAFFLSILTMKPKLMLFYMKYFNEYYEEYYTKVAKTYEDKIQFWIACCIVLFNLFKTKSVAKAVLKETECLLKGLEKTLHSIYPHKMDCNAVDPDEKENYLKRHKFEKHCHSEFRKLKELRFSKIKL